LFVVEKKLSLRTPEHISMKRSTSIFIGVKKPLGSAVVVVQPRKYLQQLKKNLRTTKKKKY
jgi:hypothetical protein